MVINCCIIDDEKLCIASLKSDLERYYPNIHIVETFQKPLLGLEYLKKNNVDILFLDIDMPELTGLQLLEALGEINFEVIFTTAYDMYAVKAFRLNAADYLLKPIAKQDLEAAIKKTVQKIEQKTRDNIKTKIPLVDSNGIELIELNDIIYCEADRNYTTFYFTNGKHKVLSKNIGEYEKILNSKIFLRIHQSHIVNTTLIKKINKGDNYSVIMINDIELSVSRARKSDLMSLISHL